MWIKSMFNKTKDEKVGPVPAVDHSWQAHRALIACVMLQGVIEGLPLCFGIFQNHYEHLQYPGYSNAAWIGNISLGMLYIGAPLMTDLVEVRKINAKIFVWAAWITLLLSLVTAAFCKTIPQLIFTQGVLLGLSSLLIEMPGLLILNTWFVERRGFAYGVLFGFTDIFGAAFGYLARALLDRGLQTTMLVFAATAFVLPATAIMSFNPRPNSSLASEAHVEPSSPLRRRTLLSRPLFWIFILTVCSQSLAFYVPSVYLPSYNMQVLSGIVDCTQENTNLLAVFNLAQIPGEFFFGWASDRYNVHMLSVVSSGIAGLATFFLWAGLIGKISVSFAGLCVFAGLFGAFGGGFLTLWGQMSLAFGEERSQTAYSIISCVRGVSTLLSGPISISLLSWGGRLTNGVDFVQEGGRGYDSQYRLLILFVGSCMSLAALLACSGAVVDKVTQSRSADVDNERGSVELNDQDPLQEKETWMDKKKRDSMMVTDLGFCEPSP